MKKTLSQIGEFELIHKIERLFPPLDKNVIRGAGDDTAVLSWTKGQQLLLTTDMLVEGVHFKAGAPARGIGHKALAVNISDIAAMGGKPTAAVVAIGLPPSTDFAFVQDIYRGLGRVARKFGVSIVGGDTVRSNALVLNVSLLGTVRRRDLVLRSGARAGDTIYVTGPLGRAWQEGRDMSFTPRVKIMQDLLRQGIRPTAGIDISDGLLADLGHVLEQSGVGAEVVRDNIPCRRGATWQEASCDGEDFELLLTLSPAQTRRLAAWTRRPAGLTAIGRITGDRGKMVLLDARGKALRFPRSGFKHF